MLGSNEIIGFIPTKNADDARSFYQSKLGLEFESDDGFALVFRSKSLMVRIVRVENFAAAPYTILGWEVENMPDLVRSLNERGVVFERYPWIEQDELGIWVSPNGNRIAWFKDPDGNVLSISQH